MPPNAATEVDEGICLSMHQPWASLLVYGIKRIEGRGWPTTHRGRLWIHATSQQLSEEDIQAYESLYRRLHCELDGQPALEFPQSYPTSALLGCVEVVDCVSAEQVEAWESLPPSLPAEVGSPFCFLCERPQRLVVLHPMRGQQKLYKLDKKVHRAACQGLKPAPNALGFSWAAFGPPPAMDAALPPSQNKHIFAKHQAAAAANKGASRKARKGTQVQSPRAAAAAAMAELQVSGVEDGSDGTEQQQQQQYEQQDPARRLRAVRKKLRQAAALAERVAAGGSQQALSAEERAKLESVQALQHEATALEAQLQQQQQHQKEK